MKPICTILILLFLGVLLGCKKEDSTPKDAVSYAHLEFFGFTLIDVGWDDPTDAEVKTNYLNEVRDFTNIADILITSPADNIVNRIRKMEIAEVKTILNIYFLLFEPVSGMAPSGNRLGLRADYEERWNQFITTNQLAALTSNIGAFYVGEEPTWNGISADELRIACDLVKGDFPTTPIMIIESFAILDELEVPSSADWVGFDQYFIKNPTLNPSFQANLSLLKTKINGSQKVVLVMDTHHYTIGHVDQGNIQLEEMGEVATHYSELAGGDTSVIGILGYFWPNGFDDPSAKGARGMSTLIIEKYKQIGRDITGK